MKTRNHPFRLYAALLIFGAGVLLFRTVRMAFVEGGLEQSTWWVLVLLFIEMAFDIGCMAASIRWLITAEAKHSRPALRLGTAATLMHAVRVLVYVLGRTGPWTNFDIRPEFRSTVAYDRFWVWFAAILAVLGVIAVIILWRILVRIRKRSAAADI